MVIKSELYEFPDENGNKLVFKMCFNQYLRPVTATVYLKLADSPSYPRQIGYVDVPTKTFHCFRDSAKHLHIKSNSYGFNYFLTDKKFGIEKIKVKIDNVSYCFDTELLNSDSAVMFYKSQGFEVQKFLPFDIIKNHKVGRKKTISARV